MCYCKPMNVCSLCFTLKPFQMFCEWVGNLAQLPLARRNHFYRIIRVHPQENPYADMLIKILHLWSFLQRYKCTFTVQRDRYHYIFIQYIISIDHLHPISLPCLGPVLFPIGHLLHHIHYNQKS